jgi:acetamidase/formamidase
LIKIELTHLNLLRPSYFRLHDTGVECVDWTGGQIKNDDSSDDVKNVDLSQVHYLSGPIEVEGAQPGDLLKVEFLNLGPLDNDEWGFTGTFAKENGGGFLTDVSNTTWCSGHLFKIVCPKFHSCTC